jgi:hypothetical protein
VWCLWSWELGLELEPEAGGPSRPPPSASASALCSLRSALCSELQYNNSPCVMMRHGRCVMHDSDPARSNESV